MRSIIQRRLVGTTRFILFVFLLLPLSAIPSACDAPTGLELPDDEEEEEEEDEDEEDT